MSWLVRLERRAAPSVPRRPSAFRWLYRTRGGRFRIGAGNETNVGCPTEYFDDMQVGDCARLDRLFRVAINCRFRDLAGGLANDQATLRLVHRLRISRF